MPMTDFNATIEVLDPEAEAAPPAGDLAQRLPSLWECTIALVDNVKPNAGLLLSEIGRLIEAANPTVRWHFIRKQIASKPMTAEAFEETRAHCQAAIIAVGD